MKKYERIVIDFCEKHLCEIFFIVITLLSFITRRSMRSFLAGDYYKDINPWFELFKTNGGFKALANHPSNYSPLYLTLMALLSYFPSDSAYLVKYFFIIFDYLLAFMIGKITSYLSKDNKKEMFILGYTICLFIPSVLTNSALWGQCDALYSFFTVASFYYLLKEDYTKTFILYGIAFSLKQQAIFIIPLYIVYYVIKRKFSILNFLIIPLIYLITCLPAIIAGRPISTCLGLYSSQTELFNYFLVLNFPNIWNIASGDTEILYTVGELLAVSFCGIALFYCLFKKTKLNNEQTLTLSLWFLIVMTYTLPAMHERYLYVGEALAVSYLLVYKKNFPIMGFVIFSPIITYSSYLFGFNNDFMVYLALIYLVLIIIFTINTFKLLANNKD